jgi:hypothetical protein
MTTRTSRLSVGTCLLTSSSRASRSRPRSNGVMSSVTNASVSSMRIFMRRIVLRSATHPGLTRRDYWLAAGAAGVTMSSFVLSTIASNSPRSRSGTPNFARVWWKSSMNASHSAPETSSSRCESRIVRPE